MRILLSQLKRLKVETQSGVMLGKIRDCELDVESHAVVQYIVRPFPVAAGGLMISPAQIKSIGDGKIIVDDAVKKAEGTGTVSVIPKADAEPVAMRE